MIDLTKPEEQEAIEGLRKFVTSSDKGAMAFILAMRNSDGKLELHPRSHQPCYGELRKYHHYYIDDDEDGEIRECEDYTDPQPHDTYRPSDLHDPFPSGTPEGLGLNLAYGSHLLLGYFRDEANLMVETRDRLLRFLFSEESPWLRGLVPGTIEFVTNTIMFKCDIEDEKGKRISYGDCFEKELIVGIIMRDLAVDPTVMVNLFNCTRHYFTSYARIKIAKDLFRVGATEKEVLGYILSTHGPSHDTTKFSASSGMGYYFPYLLDWEMFSSGRSHDLTGGLLSDRYDYNRKRLHDIFQADLESYQENKHFDETENAYIWKGRKTFELLNQTAQELGIKELSPENILLIFRKTFNIESVKSVKTA